MKYCECLQAGLEKLNDVGIADARCDAQILMEYVCNIDRQKYLLIMNDEMPEDKQASYMELIAKRAKRIPLQHLTGLAPFFGHDFYVNEHVLVPRFDTEVLVEEALSCVCDGNLTVLDLCTGSGCIGLSLACELSQAKIVLSDISSEALAVAKRNIDKLSNEGVLNGDMINTVQSDLFDNISVDDYRFDMIVCNPPYIRWEDKDTLEPEVFDHDPHLALFADDGGMYFYKKIIKLAPYYLKEDGYLLFEIGYDQGRDVIYIMKEAGFKDIYMKNDLSNNNRVVRGVYHV